MTAACPYQFTSFALFRLAIYLWLIAWQSPKSLLSMSLHDSTFPLVDASQLESTEDISDRDDVSKDSKRRSAGQRLSSLWHKVKGVNWRSVFTVAAVVLNYFLVNTSVSLLAAFFPPKVSVDMLPSFLIVAMCL